MHPKTFDVVIRWRSPLTPSLRMYVHADTWRAALDWAARVFPGVDTKPTEDLWEGRRAPRIGNTDPVHLFDRDKYRQTRRVGGKRVVIPTPPGAYRCSREEVAASLLQVFRRLQDERVALLGSFKTASTFYARHNDPRDYARLQALARALDAQILWQDHLWTEYRRIESRPPLPPVTHAEEAATAA